jgi:RNA polymerase sigma-70 factor, ECF subfamily
VSDAERRRAGSQNDDRAGREALDLAAIRRIQAGDEGAVADLYDRYASTALALALRIVRDRTEAEDVVHDAFVAVVERADQFHPERGSVVAWLVTTVRNAALDRSRRRARRAQIADEELRHEPPEQVPDPERETLLARDREAVRRALAHLSETHRATLETAFFDGLTYPEIAARDSVPVGTVKSRAARALSALRAALDEAPPSSSTAP